MTAELEKINERLAQLEKEALEKAEELKKIGFYN